MKWAIVQSGSETDPCCCETECCLYPASLLGAGTYPVEDLPDTIKINGVVATKTIGVSGLTSGVAYLVGTGGDVGDYAIILYNGGGTPPFYGWGAYELYGEPLDPYFIPYWDGSMSINNNYECLIFVLHDDVEDQFSATYTATIPASTGHDFTVNETSVTLTRESLCVWSGTGEFTGTFVPDGTWTISAPVRMFYWEGHPVKPHFMISSPVFDTPTDGSPPVLDGEATTEKDDPQSSPDGTYGGITVA